MDNNFGEIIRQDEYFKKFKEYDRVVLFGAGSKAHQAWGIFKRFGILISDVCDNDKTRWGETFESLVIRPFDEVYAKHKDSKLLIIIATSINNALSIKQTLESRYSDLDITHLCIPFKTESGLLWQDEYDKHQKELEHIEKHIGDEKSVEIYRKCLNYKMTGSFLELAEIQDVNDEEYTFFDREIIGNGENRSLIDIGAYTGDTAISFAMFTAGRYESIDAFEADDGIYEALEKCAEFSRIPRFNTHKQALWSETETRSWYTVQDGNNIHYDSPNLFRSVNDTVDRRTIDESGDRDGDLSKTTSIDVCSLDEYINDQNMKFNDPILKINAMAADYDILKGSKEVIRAFKPLIILEYGVKAEDLYNMIPFILSVNSDYRFYFRVKRVFGDIKVVMFAKEIKGV